MQPDDQPGAKSSSVEQTSSGESLAPNASRRGMVLIFIALFNSILGLSVLFPIMGPLGRELGLTELSIGALMTSYALMQFLMAPVWGRRSETRGRKPILLTGIIGFGGTFAVFAVVAELGLTKVMSPGAVFAGLLAARVLGGIFSSATLPTAQAYVADLTARKDRTAGMAMVGAAFGLGVIFGPAIGAGLATISLLAPVYFSSCAALLNALFVALWLPEPTKKQHVERPPELLPVAARVWPLLAVGGAASLAAVSMEQTIAFYFQDRLQLDATATARTVGISLIFYGVIAVFAQGFLVRRYRWPPFTLLRLGVPFALCGLTVLVFAHSMLGLTLALVLQGLGQGLVLPGVTAAISLSVGDHEQGAVAGLNSSAQSFGRMLGPVAGTGLYELKPHYPYVFGASLLALVLLMLWTNPGLRRALEASEAET